MDREKPVFAFGTQRRNMERTMGIRPQIPGNRLYAIQTLVIVLVLTYLMLPGDRDEPGIEMTSAAPSFYEHWRWKSSLDDFDIDGELERLQLDDYARDQQIRRPVFGQT